MRQTRVSRLHKKDKKDFGTKDGGGKSIKRGSSLSNPVILFVLIFGLWVIYLRGSVTTETAPLQHHPAGGSMFNSEESSRSGNINSLPSLSTPSLSVDSECNDGTWCTIPMPKTSHYDFAPAPTNLTRWRQAQILASQGVPVLLQKICTYFSHPDDFLDGDPFGRNYDRMMDIFLNFETLLTPLTGGKRNAPVSKEIKLLHKKQFARPQYVNSYSSRAPLVQLGSYKYTGRRFVTESGDNIRVLHLNTFLTEFEAMEADLERPCIFFAAMNKDWGYLSNSVPKRVNSPVSSKDQKRLLTALNSDKIIMLVINQHSNITHPKLLTLPYGLVLESYFDKKAVWDSMNFLSNSNYVKKSSLIYSGEHLSPHGTKIVEEMSKRIPPANWLSANEGVVVDNATSSQQRNAEYYRRLSRAMIGLFLPDIGFDSYRHWEMLYMGLIGVAERHRGLDKLYWKLPIVLVQDFAEVTSTMLRSAYVEGIYHIDIFEFERLRQSYWYALIYNAARKGSAKPMIENFPGV